MHWRKAKADRYAVSESSLDSCFLTAKKAIESGKLGEIVEVESHFDYYRPVAETKPGLPQDGAFYGLGVHTMDQIISLFGRPDHVAYDIRSLRNKANPDDTFEAQLFYGDLKSHRQKPAIW